ncbi:MAG: hypothetical protein ABI140_20840, partial [Jatrophihabitantaceae bacterium]
PEAVAALPQAQQQQLNAAIQSWPCSSKIKPLDVPTKPIITCDDSNPQNKYLLGPVIVAGTEVKTAAAVPPGAVQGQFAWTVTVDLKPKGQAAWRPTPPSTTSRSARPTSATRSPTPWTAG